jgi:hypothetical protein
MSNTWTIDDAARDAAALEHNLDHELTFHELDAPDRVMMTLAANYATHCHTMLREMAKRAACKAVQA